MKQLYITKGPQGYSFLDRDKFVGIVSMLGGYRMVFEGGIMFEVPKEQIAEDLIDLGFDDVSKLLGEEK